MTTEETKTAGWNLSQGIIIELSELLARASNCYVNRDIEKAFDCLKASYFRVVCYLNKEELAEFKNVATNFKVEFSKSRPKSIFDETSVITVLSKARAMELYAEYNRLLMIALRKYGLFITDKEDQTNLIA